MSTLLFILPFLLFYTLIVVYAERKLSAFMQDRLGPMEVGHYGMLQTVADLLKLLQKEDIIHHGADRILFKAAPFVVFGAVFTGFSLIPLAPSWSGAGAASGIFLLFAIISLDVIGIMMAGWSSHNKYSALGTLRAAAQVISYEVPLTLCILAVVIHAGTMDLQVISFQQGTASVTGFLAWNIIQQPLLIPVGIIFFLTSLAECNRAPFDLPEAESELVAGYQTEYSGFRWAILMLAEYAMMLLMSFLFTILFLGSWNTPLPNIGELKFADWTTGAVWGLFWITSKALTMVGVQIWVRWSYPRVRIDHLMSLGWKWFTPVMLALVILIGGWKLI